jgi:hypothetical protein
MRDSVRSSIEDAGPPVINPPSILPMGAVHKNCSLNYKLLTMIVHQNFIRFAAVCCFLSVVTTLGIHAFFPDAPPSFEERVLLYRNPVYILNRWWVIVHCLLVIAAMWGFALLQFRKTPGMTGLGFLFFCVFGIAEIARQFFVLMYMNELREQFVASSEPAVQTAIKTALTYSPQLTAPLFGLFIMSFGLGGICYAFSIWHEKGFGKWVAVVMLVSGVMSLVFLANSFWKDAALERFFEKFNLIFTPMMRLLIGAWLWKKATMLSPTVPSPALRLA